MSRTKYIYALTLISIFFIFNACEDNPAKHHDHDHHFEAIGLYVINSGDTIVTYKDGSVTGSIDVKSDDMTALLSVKFIAEDGDVGIPEGDEYGFDWEVADIEIADVHSHNDEIEEYKFHVEGFQVGVTSVKLIINHNDHKDFESKNIPINVVQ